MIGNARQFTNEGEYKIVSNFKIPFVRLLLMVQQKT